MATPYLSERNPAECLAESTAHQLRRDHRHYDRDYSFTCGEAYSLDDLGT